MVKHLSNPPKLHGISKTKVIMFLGIIGVVLVLAITIGILDDGVSVDSIDEGIITQQNYTNKQTDQVLDKVRQNQEQQAHVVESIIPPVVPPISLKSSEIVEDDPLAKKSREERYLSQRAKSLVYTKDMHPNSSAPQVMVTRESLANIASTQQITEHNSDIYSGVIKTSTSPYEVKAGSVIPAIMINGINSDLSGIVTAMVRQNVYDSVRRKYLLIPQGAKLIGKYDSNIIYGQERLVVAWTRLIYPNGDSIDLAAIPGSDIAGYSGFSDQVDNKYWKIFGSSFIMGVITASMQYSQNNTNPNVQVGGIGITNTDPTFGQTLSGSLGQQMGQTGMIVTQKNLNVKPTITIRPHYPFNIILTADLALKPY